MVEGRRRQELYRAFLEWVGADIQRERSLVNRRMFNVFIWCFLLPALVYVTVLLLVKANIFPRTARANLDWLVLVFPVLYSLYILGSEVISQVPATYRRGGISSQLSQSIQGGEWRDRVCDGLTTSIHANAQDWTWVVESFRIDLMAMQYRTRYLTALAGAVFFLIMQGIDSLGDSESKVAWLKTPMGWVEASGDNLSQFVGLALFLVLLYLSGNQSFHSLERYLRCAELVARIKGQGPSQFSRDNEL